MKGTKSFSYYYILLSIIQTHPWRICLYSSFVLCKHIVHQFYFIIALQPVRAVKSQMLV